MAINFEKLDDTAYMVVESGSYFILLESNVRGWGAKGYFNGGADISVGHKYQSHEDAYQALKEKVESAIGKLSAVQL